jgi:hypothetical protein
MTDRMIDRKNTQLEPWDENGEPVDGWLVLAGTGYPVRLDDDDEAVAFFPTEHDARRWIDDHPTARNPYAVPVRRVFGEACGACGFRHAEGECDLDPANAPSECRYCGTAHDVDHECEPAERRVFDVDAYDERCRWAATNQGLDPITARLTAEGIAHDVDQTGGFTMCVRVDRPDGWYVYVTDGEYGNGNWILGAYAEDYDTPAGSTGVCLSGEGSATADEGVALLRRFLADEIPNGCAYCACAGCQSCGYVGYVVENVEVAQ